MRRQSVAWTPSGKPHRQPTERIDGRDETTQEEVRLSPPDDETQDREDHLNQS